MDTVNPKSRVDRRSLILDAAERCFARSGFHQASMSDICQAANMSAGNLYRYFPSKEAIIAGITERHRAQVATDFDAVEKAPSFFEGLAMLARQHMSDCSEDEINLSVEIIAESRRSPAIAKLFQDLGDDVKARLVALLASAAQRGEIDPALDFETAASMLMMLADGISLRRVADRNFDVDRALPFVFKMVESLLGRSTATSRTEKAIS